MSKIRPMLVATVAVAAAALLVVPTAHAAPAADPGDQYQTQATAAALRVNVFGQGFTVGSATTIADSSPLAHAKGMGGVVSTQSFGASEASANSEGQTAGSDTPTCSQLTLPAEVPLLDLSAACSTSQAAVTASGPVATSTGTSMAIKLSGDPALSAIPVSDLTQEITDTLLGGL